MYAWKHFYCLYEQKNQMRKKKSETDNYLAISEYFQTTTLANWTLNLIIDNYLEEIWINLQFFLLIAYLHM